MLVAYVFGLFGIWVTSLLLRQVLDAVRELRDALTEIDHLGAECEEVHKDRWLK